MSLWLTDEEIQERTLYKQHDKQCVELARQGVPFVRRRDGFPLVDRALFDVKPVAQKKLKPLNYGAL